MQEEVNNIVVQVNGKKRGLIQLSTNTTEEDVLEKISKDEKLSKYLYQQEIKEKYI